MSTPMAISASKGAVEALLVGAELDGVEVRAGAKRSEVLEPRRSPPVEVEVLCAWEAV
jgi:hypothetical protein